MYSTELLLPRTPRGTLNVTWEKYMGEEGAKAGEYAEAYSQRP